MENGQRPSIDRYRILDRDDPGDPGEGIPIDKQSSPVEKKKQGRVIGQDKRSVIRKLKVIIGCEQSGIVRDAFRKLGHDAWSCDLLSDENDSKYHIRGDIFECLDNYKPFDLGIFFPTCTYLTNSGVCWIHKKEGRWNDMRKGALFFKKLLNVDIPMVAVENPIMHKYAIEIIGRRQNQVIQPYMFGHPERKATCLWLKNLKPLVPTLDVKEEMMKLPKNIAQRIHHTPPGQDRWKIRSRTFPGVGYAMALQWGGKCV